MKRRHLWDASKLVYSAWFWCCGLHCHCGGVRPRRRRGRSTPAWTGRTVFTFLEIVIGKLAVWDLTLLPLCLILGGGSDERVIQVQGTIIFDGSGNASVTQTAVVNFGGQATRKNQETCPFTYVVSADGTFTLQGNCSGFHLQGGPLAGQTVSTTGIKLKGQIGTRRRTLIFFGDGPNIETFVAGNSGILQQQLCSQTGTAVRI